MARWQLTEPHYLNVPGTYWEQVSTDRITQRPIRKQFPVPRLLDPRLKDDWNYGVDGGAIRQDDMDGQIIVCYAGKGSPKDIIFEGDPTPGMLPLDDEAREISGKYSWTPTERVYDQYNPDDTSTQAKVLAGLTKQLADAMVSGPTSQAPAGFDKFMESMAAMMQQQTMMFAAMMERMQVGEFVKQAQAAGAEPPVDAEPLSEAEPPTPEELAEATRLAAERDAASATKAKKVVSGGRMF